VFAFFVVVHVLICLALVLVVLLQSGRGGGLAGAFGGGAAQTFFGGRGAATFLSKATAWLAVGFMAMSVLLAVLSSRTGATGGGLLQQRARQRAGEVQLPPSTSSLNPRAALDSLELAPAGAEPAAAPGDTAPSP
jgi:preprotein translocase subunit SecG